MPHLNGHALPEVLVAASVLGLSWASAQWVHQQSMGRATQAAQMSKASRVLSDTLNEPGWTHWPESVPEPALDSSIPSVWRDPNIDGASTSQMLHATLPWLTRYGQRQTLSQSSLQSHWPASILATAPLAPQVWFGPIQVRPATPERPVSLPWWSSRSADGHWTLKLDELTYLVFNAEGTLMSKCQGGATDQTNPQCVPASGQVLHGWLKATFMPPFVVQGGDPLPPLTIHILSPLNNPIGLSPPDQPTSVPCQVWPFPTPPSPVTGVPPVSQAWPVPAPHSLVYQCHVPHQWSAARAFAHLQVTPMQVADRAAASGAATPSDGAAPAASTWRICRVVGGIPGDTTPSPTWLEHLLILPAHATCPADKAQFLYSLPLTNP